MRSADRSSVAPPAALCELTGGRDSWGGADARACRAEIRERLRALQATLCAYCEGHLDQWGQHIEHLHPRSAYPHLTFDWTNLFLSCSQDDSCGRFKDHRAGNFNPGLLVDPTQEDPDHYFVFRTSGKIDVREGLTPQEKAKAEETIRVFNLNLDRKERSLVRLRRLELNNYEQREPDLVGFLAELEESERAEFIEAELQELRDAPFGAIVRQFLTRAA